MSTYEKISEKIEGQTQTLPGNEHEMDPRPIYIRESYKGSQKLLNKKALITGGDSGIGRAVAVHFAREGADVAIVYLSEDQDAQETKRLVENEGRRCILIKGDLRNRDFCVDAVEQTAQQLGGINILINHAGEQRPTTDLGELDLDLMEKTFETNIFAMYYITKPCMKYLKEGDCIITTTSVTAYEGSPRFLDYAATNGAITTFTRSLAKNFAKLKIRVNGVAPGPIWTPLIPASFSEKDVAEFGKKTPMKRPGQPSEVAPAYVFLACDDASYITGQVIHPNGGMAMYT